MALDLNEVVPKPISVTDIKPPTLKIPSLQRQQRSTNPAIFGNGANNELIQAVTTYNKYKDTTFNVGNEKFYVSPQDQKAINSGYVDTWRKFTNVNDIAANNQGFITSTAYGISNTLNNVIGDTIGGLFDLGDLTVRLFNGDLLTEGLKESNKTFLGKIADEIDTYQDDLMLDIFVNNNKTTASSIWDYTMANVLPTVGQIASFFIPSTLGAKAGQVIGKVASLNNFSKSAKYINTLEKANGISFGKTFEEKLNTVLNMTKGRIDDLSNEINTAEEGIDIVSKQISLADQYGKAKLLYDAQNKTQKIQGLGQLLGGAFSSRLLESSMEADETYKKALTYYHQKLAQENPNLSPEELTKKAKEEADKSANLNFWSNMPLIVQDMFHISSILKPFKFVQSKTFKEFDDLLYNSGSFSEALYKQGSNLEKNLFSKYLTNNSDKIFSFKNTVNQLGEGLEEVYQHASSENAVKNNNATTSDNIFNTVFKTNYITKDAGESFLLGVLGGYAFHGIGKVFEKGKDIYFKNKEGETWLNSSDELLKNVGQKVSDKQNDLKDHLVQSLQAVVNKDETQYEALNTEYFNKIAFSSAINGELKYITDPLQKIVEADAKKLVEYGLLEEENIDLAQTVKEDAQRKLNTANKIENSFNRIFQNKNQTFVDIQGKKVNIEPIVEINKLVKEIEIKTIEEQIEKSTTIEEKKKEEKKLDEKKEELKNITSETVQQDINTTVENYLKEEKNKQEAIKLRELEIRRQIEESPNDTFQLTIEEKEKIKNGLDLTQHFESETVLKQHHVVFNEAKLITNPDGTINYNPNFQSIVETDKAFHYVIKDDVANLSKIFSFDKNEDAEEEIFQQLENDKLYEFALHHKEELDIIDSEPLTVEIDENDTELNEEIEENLNTENTNIQDDSLNIQTLTTADLNDYDGVNFENSEIDEDYITIDEDYITDEEFNFTDVVDENDSFEIIEIITDFNKKKKLEFENFDDIKNVKDKNIEIDFSLLQIPNTGINIYTVDDNTLTKKFNNDTKLYLEDVESLELIDNELYFKIPISKYKNLILDVKNLTKDDYFYVQYEDSSKAIFAKMEHNNKVYRSTLYLTKLEIQQLFNNRNNNIQLNITESNLLKESKDVIFSKDLKLKKSNPILVRIGNNLKTLNGNTVIQDFKNKNINTVFTIEHNGNILKYNYIQYLTDNSFSALKTEIEKYGQEVIKLFFKDIKIFNAILNANTLNEALTMLNLKNINIYIPLTSITDPDIEENKYNIYENVLEVKNIENITTLYLNGYTIEDKKIINTEQLPIIENVNSNTDLTDIIPKKDIYINDEDLPILDFSNEDSLFSKFVDSSIPDKILEEELTNLGTELGINFKFNSNINAYKTLQKVIELSNNRDRYTLTEELAHGITFMLPNNMLDQMLNNIQNWSRYKEFYELYKYEYRTQKEVQLEIIGQAIKESYKLKSENWIKSLINDFLNLIKGLKNVSDIAELMITKNYDAILDLNIVQLVENNTLEKNC